MTSLMNSSAEKAIIDSESLRIPSRIRIEFENQLGHDFERLFEDDLESYRNYIKEALHSVFRFFEVRSFYAQERVQVLTWHYSSRYRSDVLNEDSGVWISGQFPVTDDSRIQQQILAGKMLPHPGQRHPYIGIYGSEEKRERRRKGGPVCIMLPMGEASVPPLWGDKALYIPTEVTRILVELRAKHKDQDSVPKGRACLQIEELHSSFIPQLMAWMNDIASHEIDKSSAVDNLFPSLYVALDLMHEEPVDRSVVLCPVYVGGREVGGIAHACIGLVSRPAALIAELAANSFLGYLRLREDALAHRLIERHQVLTQARNFFIQRLAHNLRHPLDNLQSTISSFLEAAKSVPEQIEHLQTMMDQTVFAVRGRDPVKLLTPVKRTDSVSEFMADMRHYFKARFEESGKELDIADISEDWRFDIDRGMMYEVFENLLANALEHGGKHTRIVVEKKSLFYIITVSDDGEGIPLEADRARLFRPAIPTHDQLDDPNPRGNGLAFAKLLLERHNAHIEYKHKETDNWKSNFVIRFPEK